MGSVHGPCSVSTFRYASTIHKINLDSLAGIHNVKNILTCCSISEYFAIEKLLYYFFYSEKMSENKSRYFPRGVSSLMGGGVLWV